MKTIFVIFTGGTIGSQVKSKEINVNDEQKYILLEHFYENYDGEDVEIKTLSPIYTLSENMTCEKWKNIVGAVRSALESKPDGIIVTHGTDTLAYTSCMLGYMFAGVNIPIVVVSSNKPLSDETGNGFANFMSAANFIINANVKGVYVAYRDKFGSDNIILATRTTQATQITGEVLSASGEPFGKMVDGKFCYIPSEYNPTVEEVNNKKFVPSGYTPNFSNEFMLIKPYVSMNYEFFHSKFKAKFILHELYHSGTCCVEGETTSLINFAKYCKQNSIDLYLTPMDIKQKNYASTTALKENNVKILKGISIEAALVKLMIGYGNFDVAKIRDTFIEQDLFFEYMK